MTSEIVSVRAADQAPSTKAFTARTCQLHTPAALKAYAGKYGAGPQWQMLTGSLDDSIAVQRAFDVYRGDKMNHQPATFLRAGPGQPWVRLDGFASAADILREYRRIAAN